MMMPTNYTPHGMPYHDPAAIMPAGYLDGEYFEGDETYEGEYGGEYCADCDGDGGACASCLGLGGPACNAHWFDFHAEYMSLERQDVSRRVAFTQQGGNVVLSSDSLDFDQEEAGMRLTASFIFTPGYDLEVTYFGTFDKFHDSASVTGPNNLNSAFSDAATNPAGGFLETDSASFHGIDYASRIHNGEINFRRRWANPQLRAQGSTLWGFRYFRLDEELGHDTVAAAVGESLTYDLNTTNDLFGMQIGGDIYFCVLPGVMLGGEFEAGGYLNHVENYERIVASTVTDPIVSEIDDDDFALVAEASLVSIVQLTKRMRLRTAYTLLYVEGVGLAMENFNPNRNFTAPNTTAPFTPNPEFLNSNGNVFYQGLTGGLEWVW